MDKPRRTSRVMRSPIGPLVLSVEDDALVEIDVAAPAASVTAAELEESTAPCSSSAERVLDEVARQLGAYFAGKLRTFDLPLSPRGTSFQAAVWTGLREIPYGETRSYTDVARGIGRPTAVRAVGRANAQNPLAIVVPCHRVIGADGSPAGYSGGVDKKRALLELESRVVKARGGR